MNKIVIKTFPTLQNDILSDKPCVPIINNAFSEIFFQYKKANMKTNRYLLALLTSENLLSKKE